MNKKPDREKVIQGLNDAINRADFDDGIVKMTKEVCKIIIDSLEGMGWISVKDRLPEQHSEDPGDSLDPDARYLISKYVLVTDGTTVDITRICDEEWENECRCEYPITHWMPLPEPPEKGEGNESD